MKVQCFVMAQKASVTADGILDITGIFDSMRVPALWRNSEIRWRPCFIVAVVAWREAEDGLQPDIGIRFRNEDGPVVGGGHGTLKPIPSATGRAMRYPLILPLNNLLLPKPGDYLAELIGNSEVIAEYNFYVDVASP